ncbi:hypothetical protein E2C01_074748 [Portunus trituberculatus]|uniref:Uncharacterized protein n=1 Tax=Portunus trituberculatus TaxID=210409 RepID=A0A5B7IH23_PORTR|nr:hypothetical protein [Portunus trituberculatus]
MQEARCYPDTGVVFNGYFQGDSNTSLEEEHCPEAVLGFSAMGLKYSGVGLIYIYIHGVKTQGDLALWQRLHPHKPSAAASVSRPDMLIPQRQGQSPSPSPPQSPTTTTTTTTTITAATNAKADSPTTTTITTSH